MHRTRPLLDTLSKLTLAALLALVAACGNNDHGSSFFDSNRQAEPFPGCEDEFFGECRYWEASCQERVFATVRCMSDTADSDIPPVIEITASELSDELTAEIEADDSDSEATDAYNRAMVLIGLAVDGDLSTEESVDAFVATVPAFYTPGTSAVTIVVNDDGSHSSDDYGNTLTLAHEFVHSIQDQEHNLTRIQEQFETTSEGYLATLSAVEGEATLIEVFYDAASSGYPIDRIDFRSYFLDWHAEAEAMLAGMTPLLAAPRVFPYTYGGRYAYNVYETGGTAALRALPLNIPGATLDVMESENTVVNLDLPPPFESVASPPAGYSFVGYDVIGAWMLKKLVEFQGLPRVYSGDVLDWGRDQLAIYKNPDGKVAVIWRLEFTSSNAAAALSEAFSGADFYPDGAARDVRLSDSTVTLLVTDDATDLDLWTAALDSGETQSPEGTPAEQEDDTATKAPRLVDMLRRRVPSRTRPGQGMLAARLVPRARPDARHATSGRE